MFEIFAENLSETSVGKLDFRNFSLQIFHLLLIIKVPYVIAILLNPNVHTEDKKGITI